MKNRLIISAAAIIILGTGVVWADTPELEPAIYIQDGQQNLEVTLYSIPTSVDWNNDGKKDLVIGQLLFGYVWLYLNTGTDLNPVFDGGSMIGSNDTPISVSWG